MTSRNLTEVFIIMRNNSIKNRNIYSDNYRRNSDSDKLLRRSTHDLEEGLELINDGSSPPIWLDKLEEAQYIMSKIKPKLDELGSLHARHLMRPTLDDCCEEEPLIDDLSQEISKLITATHRHIQYIRSSLEIGNTIEQRLTKNVVTYLLLSLQDITVRFRNNQSSYLGQLNSREERSNKFFETTDFTTIDLNDDSKIINNVESFDNFFQPDSNASASVQQHQQQQKNSNAILYSDEQIDEQFQKPAAGRMTQTQLLLFEEEAVKFSEHREKEVTKILKSICDLNDIFKDLSHMVQEQGTVLDRIDYNVERTQQGVTDGLRQLQKAEKYQRKNRKMCCIMILAGVTLFLLVLLIFTKLN